LAVGVVRECRNRMENKGIAQVRSEKPWVQELGPPTPHQVTLCKSLKLPTFYLLVCEANSGYSHLIKTW
jgi:hypothetical protein